MNLQIAGNYQPWFIHTERHLFPKNRSLLAKGKNFLLLSQIQTV